MKKIIYGIGSVFFVVALFLVFSFGLAFFSDDPYRLSEQEFTTLYNDKAAYSYIYLGNKKIIIFICLDKNFSEKEDKRKPKCKGHRRYIKVDKLKKELLNELLTKN